MLFRLVQAAGQFPRTRDIRRMTAHHWRRFTLAIGLNDYVYVLKKP